METFTISPRVCGRSCHLIKEFAGTIHAVGQLSWHCDLPDVQRKENERESCHSVIISYYLTFDTALILWTKIHPFFYHPLSPAPRFPACLPPVALHNCSESPFFKWRYDFRHREMTSSLLSAPTAQSVSVRPQRKTISASEPLRQMCPFQYRGEGSRVKADNNRQSCAIQNPWTRDALCSVREGWASRAVCVCSHWVFYGICVGKVGPLPLISVILEKINDKNDQDDLLL